MDEHELVAAFRRLEASVDALEARLKKLELKTDQILEAGAGLADEVDHLREDVRAIREQLKPRGL